MKSKKIILLFVSVGCLGAPISRGLNIRSYDPDRHDRFDSFPTTRNTDFYKSAYDFSGVGRDDSQNNRWVAMITPEHFVAANHSSPAVGSTFTFVNASGTQESAQVASLANIKNASNENTDLVVGRFDSAMSSEVAFYPIPNFDGEGDYLGLRISVHGRDAEVGEGDIDGFEDFDDGGINSTRVYTFTYNNAAGDGDDSHGESGDSGSPSFLILDNRLAITGIHTAIFSTPGSVTTYDTFIPHYE
ncbi:MAG: hypothetical protein WD708_04360, partial [Kiritimatiellia bacterium]